MGNDEYKQLLFVLYGTRAPEFCTDKAIHTDERPRNTCQNAPFMDDENIDQKALFICSPSTVGVVDNRLRCAPISWATLIPVPIIVQDACGSEHPSKKKQDSWEDAE